MVADAFLSHILDNDVLTRGLGDEEARILVEWLVEQTERLAHAAPREISPWPAIKQLYLRARTIARFVSLWCHARRQGAAGQLAAAERFAWPLPEPCVDPCELMQSILDYETLQLAA
jgi:hypothetical protein